MPEQGIPKNEMEMTSPNLAFVEEKTAPAPEEQTAPAPVELTPKSGEAAQLREFETDETLDKVEEAAGPMTDFEAYVTALPRHSDGRFVVPVRPRDDQVATFAVCGAGGHGQWISLSPTLYELRTPPQGGAPREMPILGSEMIMRFKEGKYRTHDPNEWLLALNPEKGFGQTYTINAADPTGFWRKCGFAKIQPVVETQVNPALDPDAVAAIAHSQLPDAGVAGTVIVSGPRKITRPELS